MKKRWLRRRLLQWENFVNIAHNPQEVGIENRKNDTRFKNKSDNNVEKNTLIYFTISCQNKKS